MDAVLAGPIAAIKAKSEIIDGKCDDILADTHHLYTLLVQAVNFRWNTDANWYSFNRANNGILSDQTIDVIDGTASGYSTGNGTANNTISQGTSWRTQGSGYITDENTYHTGGITGTAPDARFTHRNVGKAAIDWVGTTFSLTGGNCAFSISGGGVAHSLSTTGSAPWSRTTETGNGPYGNDTGLTYSVGMSASRTASGGMTPTYDFTTYSLTLTLLAALIDGSNKLKMEQNSTEFDVMSSLFTVDDTVNFDMYDTFVASTENGGTWIFDIYASDGITLLKGNVAPGADISDIDPSNTSLKVRVRCTRSSTSDPIPALVNMGFNYFKRK